MQPNTNSEKAKGKSDKEGFAVFNLKIAKRSFPLLPFAFCFLPFAFFRCDVVLAAPPVPRPEVWLGPPAFNKGLRQLFEHPDEWKETRSLIDVLFYSDLNFRKQFTDDELKMWLPKLQEWNIKLGMEVGAIKPWGPTGEETFGKERANWERIERLGGRIYAVAMDEPFLCATTILKKPNEYAVEETARYIAAVRKAFPQIRIGDIETYPSIPLPDHFWWIDALSKRLAEMGVRGLDFYRIDTNWVNFYAQNHGSWSELKKLEAFCRSKKLPFSLIYWPSDYPPLKKKGLAADDTWFVSVMTQGNQYALVGGAPDQIVIESWVDGPDRLVPETADFTFTRAARDFLRRFVKR